MVIPLLANQDLTPMLAKSVAFFGERRLAEGGFH